MPVSTEVICCAAKVKLKYGEFSFIIDRLMYTVLKKEENCILHGAYYVHMYNIFIFLCSTLHDSLFKIIFMSYWALWSLSSSTFKNKSFLLFNSTNVDLHDSQFEIIFIIFIYFVLLGGAL